MRDWLGANAFLIALALILAGLFFVLFSLVRWLAPPPDVERFLGVLAALVSLAGTFYAGRALHRFIDRCLNGGSYRGSRS